MEMAAPGFSRQFAKTGNFLRILCAIRSSLAPAPVQQTFNLLKLRPHGDLAYRGKLSAKGSTLIELSPERKMPSGNRIVVSAVFACSLAGVAPTIISGAARAADDCMTEPKGQPSQGNHWYYRVDYVSHRQCWYQREERKPSQRPKSILQQTAETARQHQTADSDAKQRMEETRTEQSNAARLSEHSVPETSRQTPGSENLGRTTPSSRWPDQPISVDLSDREPSLTRSSDTDARIDPEDKMPPVAATDQFAAAERPPEYIVSSDDTFIAVLVGALAATMGGVLKYSAAPRPRRGGILGQRGTAWNAIVPDLRVPKIIFSTPVAPTRQAYVVRRPPEPSDSIEELRRLLLHQVEHGTFSRWPPYPRRQSKFC
jgi:hypothetical protein